MKKNIRTALFFLMFFIGSIQLHAQEDFEEDTPDVPPPAPIGDYVMPMLLAGIFTAWKLLGKKPQES